MLKISPGSPIPLGATIESEGINFALYSATATQVVLKLYKQKGDLPLASFTLDARINKTGNIWHIFVHHLQPPISYAYFVDGVGPLIDPYSKALNVSHKWLEEGDNYQPLSVVQESKDFDWENVQSPHYSLGELIIYEMHVRAFTEHPSSHVKHKGTFLGMVEKIPHLKKLGINAVELLPVMEFNEGEYHRKNPLTQEKLCNFWGYSTVNFFCLMNRYGWLDTLTEFKTLVKELHRNGIEVILDVVFNHSAEGGDHGPFYSYKGIDKKSYYLTSKDGKMLDFTGCGNTLRANYVPTSDMVIDVLRYFVLECHVDGFRFDLASALTRGDAGEPLPTPTLIQRITQDPILREMKLIAEAWDAAGLYQVGHFPFHSGLFAEWNGFYRDTVRKFIKGTPGSISAFAEAICGSEKLYGPGRKPDHSINFITAHDGFTLCDLVSYHHKNNLANGEENRDGNNDNESWNCGIEGPTADESVLALRQKQMKNFMVALFMSLGTPMLWMGDEYQHTREGNNNAWCHDNELNWFLWDTLEEKKGFYDFVAKLIHFRKSIPLFQGTHFYGKADIHWHGVMPSQADWGPMSQFIAYTLKDKEGHKELYIAFNSYHEPLEIKLPNAHNHKTWHLVVDTSQKSPHDFHKIPQKLDSTHLRIEQYSSLILSLE